MDKLEAISKQTRLEDAYFAVGTQSLALCHAQSSRVVVFSLLLRLGLNCAQGTRDVLVRVYHEAYWDNNPTSEQAHSENRVPRGRGNLQDIHEL